MQTPGDAEAKRALDPLGKRKKPHLHGSRLELEAIVHDIYG
jgi:hypothetical protein